MNDIIHEFKFGAIKVVVVDLIDFFTAEIEITEPEIPPLFIDDVDFASQMFEEVHDLMLALFRDEYQVWRKEKAPKCEFLDRKAGCFQEPHQEQEPSL